MWLVASKAIATSGTRMKLTYTFSTASTTAPIFISILRLTECKLTQDYCISLKIKYLYIDGGGVIIGSS